MRMPRRYSEICWILRAFAYMQWNKKKIQQCGMCDQQSLRSACAQSHQSLCKSLEYSMIVKLLTEHHLEFLSLRGGCRGWSESTRSICHIVGNLIHVHWLIYQSRLYSMNSITSIFDVSVWGNVSGYRYVSDCRSRGREFDPVPVPYFR